MALLEFFCDHCQLKFEQITSDRDPDRGKCPKCERRETRKLISRFRIGGQGDLRESTMHGCHDYTGLPGDSDHGGHTHGPGCGHSHGSGESSGSE